MSFAIIQDQSSCCDIDLLQSGQKFCLTIILNEIILDTSVIINRPSSGQHVITDTGTNIDLQSQRCELLGAETNPQIITMMAMMLSVEYFTWTNTR